MHKIGKSDVLGDIFKLFDCIGRSKQLIISVMLHQQFINKVQIKTYFVFDKINMYPKFI